MDNLLFNKRPLIINPDLAVLIGLNESIVLQQIHYWLEKKKEVRTDYYDGHYWIYNTYEQWHEQFPFWSIMTIRRTITKLESSQLLLSAKYNKAGFDKTKWYTINYQSLKNAVVSSSVQNEHMDCSSCPDGSVQSDQTNTIEYTYNTTENTITWLDSEKKNQTANSKQTGKESSFDSSILEKSIIKACQSNGLSSDDSCVHDIIKIIKYYYMRFHSAFGVEHVRLSQKAMNNVVERLLSGSEKVEDVIYENYVSMIDKHFQTQYVNCDYSICHFMTEGIRNHRYYESVY